ncbi:MAG: ribonucleoside triphosphate reductase, partial [Clostridia bacterium]|nr:ribonucleoside triphosphate reductase [Clostridia bacterium]
PHCGAEAEVYSRITGYYRPVKNWNDGKAQEYRERRTYDIGRSVLTHSGPKTTAVEMPTATATVDLADGVYLFASATCPNCKIAKTLLGKAEIAYTEIMANDNVALSEAIGIKQAPTLVTVRNGEIEKFAGVANVKTFIKGQQA